MSEAGHRGLHWLWRILFGLAIGAISLDLASTMATAMPPNDARGVPSQDFCVAKEPGRVLRADPASYQKLIPALQSGDTLLLAPGRYTRLTIANLNGEPGRCITISGPTAGPRAVIAGQAGHNTVEIVDSSYIVVANLTIDSLGTGGDGIKAPRAARSATHHVILDGNLVVGAGAYQQTDGYRPRRQPGIGSSGGTRSSVLGPGSISATPTAAARSSPESSRTISCSIPADTAWRSNINWSARPSPACRRGHNRRSSGTTSSSRTTAYRPMGIARTFWSEASPTPAPARTTSIKSTAI